jgi:hypothetical protein
MTLRLLHSFSRNSLIWFHHWFSHQTTNLSKDEAASMIKWFPVIASHSQRAWNHSICLSCLEYEENKESWPCFPEYTVPDLEELHRSIWISILPHLYLRYLSLFQDRPSLCSSQSSSRYQWVHLKYFNLMKMGLEFRFRYWFSAGSYLILPLFHCRNCVWSHLFPARDSSYFFYLNSPQILKEIAILSVFISAALDSHFYSVS